MSPLQSKSHYLLSNLESRILSVIRRPLRYFSFTFLNETLGQIENGCQNENEEICFHVKILSIDYGKIKLFKNEQIRLKIFLE